MAQSESRCPTTAADVARFARDGFVAYPEFFAPAELSGLGAALGRAVLERRERIPGAPGGGRVGAGYERVFDQLVNLWTDYPGAREIALHPRLAESARRLARAHELRIFHDHALIKPPGDASVETRWHQDLPYWDGMDRPGALSAWIALDAVDERNGCMVYLPGSARHGPLEPIALDRPGRDGLDALRARGVALPEPVAVPLPAGGVSFHDGCCLHHAGPNRSARPRRAFAVIYIPDRVRFTGGSDAAGAAAEMTPGGPWDHPLHPVVARTDEAPPV